MSKTYFSATKHDVHGAQCIISVATIHLHLLHGPMTPARLIVTPVLRNGAAL